MKSASHDSAEKKIVRRSAGGVVKKKASSLKTEADSYDAFKEFEGRRYTGMKVGRSHKWYYDSGVWSEKKLTPDLWQIAFEVKKRRAGKAPEGSGVPAGTEYHWLIVAHQNVRKLNANDYSTSLSGMKFKVAHMRADSQKWSASDRAQRKRMVQFLEDMIHQLQEQAAAENATAGEVKEPVGRQRRKVIAS
jgi:hypothetical protein